MFWPYNHYIHFRLKMVVQLKHVAAKLNKLVKTTEIELRIRKPLTLIISQVTLKYYIKTFISLRMNGPCSIHRSGTDSKRL
jgi:hypothetical protein